MICREWSQSCIWKIRSDKSGAHYLSVFAVAVVCPLDILEMRERSRGDRVIGRARGLVDVVHSFCSYDLTVDTGHADAETCVAEILTGLTAAGVKRTALAPGNA